MEALAVITALWVMVATSAAAQDAAATMGGDWSNGSIWTSGTVPDGTTNVFIGSTHPVGAAATATVSMSGNQSANNVYLGHGQGASGTLDLGTSELTVNGSLVIGSSAGGNGTGTIITGAGGFFTTSNVSVDGGSSLTFGANDSTGVLDLANNSIAEYVSAGKQHAPGVTGGPQKGIGAANHCHRVRYRVVDAGLRGVARHAEHAPVGQQHPARIGALDRHAFSQ